jgi:hypothetical protein
MKALSKASTNANGSAAILYLATRLLLCDENARQHSDRLRHSRQKFRKVLKICRRNSESYCPNTQSSGAYPGKALKILAPNPVSVADEEKLD